MTQPRTDAVERLRAVADPGGRFRPIRFHAKGGLGEVLVASDGRLKREVALKRILEPYDQDPESRRRFVREAEITGRLEHPGVVPVYDLGDDPGGKPYYAMRFISGESLKDAIRRFHKPGPQGLDADPRSRSLRLRQLLSALVSVCNTLAYAHNKGVIHRDIKPANIMLGAYGETLVVDWGLARPFTVKPLEAAPKIKADPRARRADNSELSAPTVAASTDTQRSPAAPADGVTEVGLSLGTPGYMSPEQAAAETDRMGPAADIYSVGATLYTLLTGKPPLDGMSTNAVLFKTVSGDIAPARRVNPSVPAALEAVCIKAMKVDPAHRYADARDLGADLEHWMADEPVSALPEPLRERARRWVKRHRLWVTAAVSTLVAAAAIAGASAGMLSRKNAELADAVAALDDKNLELTREHREQLQLRIAADSAAREAVERRDESRRLHKESEANFRSACAAVDRYFTHVAESPLLAAPGLHGLRRQLLEAAVEHYRAFVKRKATDPELKLEFARARHRLGLVARESINLREALSEHLAAVGLCEELERSHPKLPGLRMHAADCFHEIGKLQDNLGRRTDAMEAYNLALARLPADETERAAVRLRSRVRANIALLHRESGRFDEAIALYTQVRESFEGLLRAAPADDEAARDLALVGDHFASTRWAQGRPDLAEPMYAESIAKFVELVRRHPERLNWRMELKSIRNHFANLLRQRGRWADAQFEWQRALKEIEPFAAANPGVPEYASAVAEILVNLGGVETQSNRHAAALPLLERALDAIEPALTREGLKPTTRKLHATIVAQLLDALEKNGRGVERIALVNRAIESVGDPDGTWRLRLAVLKARAGDSNGANLLLREIGRLKQWTLREGLEFVRVQSLCAVAVAADGTLDPIKRKEIADRFAAGAVKSLEPMLRAGLREFDTLRRDPDFAPLQSREDFRKLLDDAENRGR